MSYRCIDAFIYADQVFSGGQQVDDDHPILRTHRANFAKVNEAGPSVTETASAAPGEVRIPVKKVPAKKVAPKPVTTDSDEPKGDA
ncbi:MAG TPA: hypothetical protein PLD01_16515 [Mycobacterium sp.]|nr:hypothetical protein [Mycobacterium sp.]